MTFNMTFNAAITFQAISSFELNLRLTTLVDIKVNKKAMIGTDTIEFHIQP